MDDQQADEQNGKSDGRPIDIALMWTCLCESVTDSVDELKTSCPEIVDDASLEALQFCELPIIITPADYVLRLTMANTMRGNWEKLVAAKLLRGKF